MSKQDPLTEAEESLLNKSSKLEVARQAVLTQDLAELAKADRDKVRRLEEKHLFGGDKGSCAGGGEPVGDIIVCDDYHHNDPPPVPPPLPRPAGTSRLWQAIAALALAGGGAGVGVVAVKPTTPAAPVVTPAAPAQRSLWDAVTEEQQPDGTWKEVRRERLAPGK